MTTRNVHPWTIKRCEFFKKVLVHTWVVHIGKTLSNFVLLFYMYKLCKGSGKHEKKLQYNSVHRNIECISVYLGRRCGNVHVTCGTILDCALESNIWHNNVPRPISQIILRVWQVIYKDIIVRKIVRYLSCQPVHQRWAVTSVQLADRLACASEIRVISTCYLTKHLA